MLPLVYPLLRSSPKIMEAVGTAIYRHGRAPQNPPRPYITWLLVSNRPEGQLSGAPCADFDLVQIDVWSEGDTQVEKIAYTVRDVLDGAGHANRIIMNTYDKDTKLYRLGIEVDFIQSR